MQERSRVLLEESVHSYALPTIAAGVLIAILYWARVVFITTIISVIVAPILEPFVGILIRLRIPRPLATLLVGLIAALGLYFAASAAYHQVSGLTSDVPAFKENLTAFITGITDRIENLENASSRLLIPAKKPEPAPEQQAPVRTKKKNKKDPEPPQIGLNVPGPVAVPGALVPPAIPEVRIHEDRNLIADYVYAQLGTVYEFLLMASFVPFLVYFMLSWRDHIYRSFLRFFDGPDRVAAARSLEGVAEMARAFVVGNFLIGVLLATVTWAAFAFIHIPYPFLAGILSGFLSLVPYAGMVLALLPPVLSVIAGGDRGGTVILLVLVIVLTLHLTA